MSNPETQSFWELPIGSHFLMPWETGRKIKPYERVSECEFSRPGGKRRWMMFRPHPPLQPVQMVIPVKEAA